MIRRRDEEFIDSEWSDPLERHLIPSLEREYGANHRVVREARRYEEQLRDEQRRKIQEDLKRVLGPRASG
jgi:hypothetical protein